MFLPPKRSPPLVPGWGFRRSNPKRRQLAAAIGWRLDPAQTKPEKLVRAESQQVVKLPDSGKKVSAEHFDRNASFVLPQVQLHRLCGLREIVHNENLLFSQLPDVGQNPVIRRLQKFNRSPAKDAR